MSALDDAAARVAAPGTDPDVVAALVATGLGPRGGGEALRRRCRDDPDAPPDATPRALLARHLRAPDGWTAQPTERVMRRWVTLGVRVSVVGDASYPARLAGGWPHVDAPTMLAWRGVAPSEAQVAVAIVGTRRASAYGRGVAAWIAAEVARAGVRVVSGGAVGIDAAAHRAALEEPGGTTVVLGCGHAVDYPRVHVGPSALFSRVLDEGGTLVSEHLPDVAPRPGVIRARNRIVAGLADAVVVVEGAEGSGALLTATAAADRGRPVLAVPGDVRAPGSRAPHDLLREGADVCEGPRDVLGVIDVPAAVVDTGVAGGAPVGGLPGPAAAVLARAWPRPVRVDELAAVCGGSTGALLAALTRARVAGEVVEGPEGIALARPPAPAGRR
jgi:DNA processing protein